jgi:putative MATE family efflux protein
MPSPTTPAKLTSAISQGSVHGDVWRLAWASVLTSSLMTLNTLMDRFFVGRLGSDALAAVAIGGQVLFVLVSAAFAITVGTTALVSRFTGAGDETSACRATAQAVSLSALLGVLGIGVCALTLGPYLNSIDLHPAVRVECTRFVSAAFWGVIPSFAVMTIGAAYRGIGDTRTPLLITVVANLVHLAGDWTLMLGHWGFPKLGVAGGGLAMSISQFVALGASLYGLRRTPLAPSMCLRSLMPSIEWAARVLRIGVPAAVTALLRSSSSMAFTAVLASTPQGTAAVAALGIGLAAESIAFMPGLGFGVAGAALVGQALGAGMPARARQYGWAAALQACVVMSAMGALFYFAATPFAAVFTKDVAVRGCAAEYLRIMAFSEPLLAYSMVLTGSLQGAGYTVVPTMVTVLTFWVVRVPVAYVLAGHVGLGSTGAWLAMSGSTMVSGACMMALFRYGKWQSTRV